MVDYGVNNFSFNKGKIDYNGNKKKTFDLTKFDGVSKEELINKAGGANSAQGKLIASVFQKYDTSGDGILTQEEFSAMRNDLVNIAGDGNLGGRELKKFNTNLGAANNAYSMEDLQSLVGMMVDGTDSITGVVTNGNKVRVSYDPAKANGLIEQSFTNKVLQKDVRQGSDINFPNGVTISQPEVVTRYFDDGKTPLIRWEVGSGPNSPMRVVIYENGVPARQELKYTDKNGEVTVEYEPNDSEHTKPTKITTQHPSGATEVREYTYGEDGTVTLNVTKNGEKLAPITGNSVDDVNDKLNNPVAEQPQNAEKPEPYEVKEGEVWYNLVAAKYGVSDPKTIMNIVHQLKASNNVDKNDTKMPATLNLPKEVTVGNKNYTLNIEEKADAKLLKTDATEVLANDATVAKDPNPPTNDTNPPQYTKMPLNFSVPPNAVSPVIAQAYDAEYASLANQNISNSSGTTKYDENGRIAEMLDAQGRTTVKVGTDGYFEFEYSNLMLSGKPSRTITHNFDGTVDFYTEYEYDSIGNVTLAIKRNAQGGINSINEFEYDEQGNLSRQINRDETGNVVEYETFEYDNGGNLLKQVNRDKTGVVNCYWDSARVLRNPDGTID